MIEPVGALSALQESTAVRRVSADNTFAAVVDRVSASLDTADAMAAGLALGKSTIADAAIARAKADVALEVAAVAAGRITGAINTLLQTQI